MRTSVLVAFLLFLGGRAWAGDDYTFAEKHAGATVILELELVFDTPIPAKWPNKTYSPTGWAFPGALAARAGKAAKVLRVLGGTYDAKRGVPRGIGPSIGDKWWWDAHAAGKVRVLVFAREWQKRYEPIHGVERWVSDLDPDYADAVTALEDAAKWTRATKLADVARSATNPWLRDLASGRLCLRRKNLDWDKDADVDCIIFQGNVKFLRGLGD